MTKRTHEPSREEDIDLMRRFIEADLATLGWDDLVAALAARRRVLDRVFGPTGARASGPARRASTGTGGGQGKDHRSSASGRAAKNVR